MQLRYPHTARPGLDTLWELRVTHPGGFQRPIEVMAKERLTMEDVMAAAREQGIRRLSDVDIAVLEVDGKISFFEADKA